MAAKNKHVIIYTDGACSGNPGPGGFGIILQYGEHRKEISQGFAETTNNRMELLAVITALEALKTPCDVDLYSDSKYVIDAIQKGWAVKWRSKGWMRTPKEPAKNPDLWERLLDLLDIHHVTFHWVKGHAQNENNNRCDELAVNAWKQLKK
ncbi:MAG: ribonuclease HI [Eubacteriales bacterium]|nr:ribonuclease HI [Eubacteriales bacterium]